MRTALPLALAAALAVVAVPAAHAQDAAAPGGTLLVTAGEVHDGKGHVFAPGAVFIEGGVVRHVGRKEDISAPGGVPVLDGGPHGVVIPGLVLAHTLHLAKGDDDPASVSPDVRAIDGYDFLANEKRALASGVTTLFVSPGTVRVVSGHGAVVKTAGASPERRTLIADAGLVAGIGDAVNRPPAIIEPPDLPDATKDPLLPYRAQLPVTRAGSVLLLRDLLAGASAPGVDAALRDVASGKSRLFLGAQSQGDIEAALDLIAETHTKGVLVGGMGAASVVDRIAKSGVPVVLTWPDRPGFVSATGDPAAEETRAASRRNAARLSAAGVSFALVPPDESALDETLFVCAAAERAGLSPAQALAAVTSQAASLLGVDDRVGSLEPGKDGDLVLLSGRPTDPRSFVRNTVVDGKIAYERRAETGTVIVRAAQVHVGDGRVFAPGEVAFEGGKIVEVGPSVGVPPGARFIDLGDGAVMPGLIDAFSHTGLAGEGGGVGGDLDTAITAAKAVDLADASFAHVLRQGVTAVLTAPAGGGRVAGRAAVVKTGGDGRPARVVSKDAGLVVRLSQERDLDAASKQLDGMLKRAKDYLASLEKYEKEKKEYDAWKKARDEEEAKQAAEEKKKEEAEKKSDEKKDDAKAPADGDDKEERGDRGRGRARQDKGGGGGGAKPAPKKAADEKTEPQKPATDESLQGYADALDKKVPVLVRASTVEELRAALDLLVDKWKLRVVVVGGEESRRLTERLSKAGVGVIASPRVLVTDDGHPVNLLRELSISGLPAGIGSDAYLGGAELFELLSYAVGRGLAPAAAVRMATGDAAQLLGVGERVGTLAPGRDADLILLTAPPFEADARVRSIYVGGVEVDRGE